MASSPPGSSTRSRGAPSARGAGPGCGAWALSRAVARLAGRGWLTRSGSPADARCVLITLTPAGRGVLSAATAVHASVISETLLGKLSPAEQEQLARVLARVADG